MKNQCKECGHEWHEEAAIECPSCKSDDIAEQHEGCTDGSCSL